MSKSWLAQGLVLENARDTWMVGFAIKTTDPECGAPIPTLEARAARCRVLYHNVKMDMARISTVRRTLGWQNLEHIQADMFAIQTPRFKLRNCMIFTAHERCDSAFFKLRERKHYRGENVREDYPMFGGLARLLAYLQLDSFHAHHLRRMFWRAYRKDLRSAKALINLIAACLLARFGVQMASVQDTLEGDTDIHLLIDLEYLHYNPADMGMALMAKVRRQLEDQCCYAVKSFEWRGGGPKWTVGLKVVIDRETVSEGWQ